VLPAVQETRIRSLADMARALGLSASLHRLLEIAAEEVLGALDAASVSVSRLESGTMTVRTIINVGELGPHEERWPDDEVYALDEFGPLAQVARTWRASLDDPGSDPRERALLVEFGKHCAIGSPIVVDGQLWGELYATRVAGRDDFGSLDISYLEALMAILGGAISRALREESLEALAYRDPLTGLLNRRALDEQAERAFEVAADLGRTITVVSLDVNRLKLVNDSFGHLAGDQLLLSVARAMSAAFGTLAGTLVARVGGDEFTVLATGHDPGEVVAVSDQLCRRTWPFGPGAGISAGAATVTLTAGTTITPREVFAAADRAQYVAKRGGLSSTVVADDVV
jgi:diguanylate cyclase (GGDEF)-like protein